MTNGLDQLAVRWTRVAANTPAVAAKAMNQASLLLVSYIKRQKLSGSPIKRRTGNLSSHISYQMEQTSDVVTSRVGVLRGVPYARGLEEGTRPHVITAHGKALRFMRAGKAVFAKRVNHPGNPPFRFLRSSLDENREAIRAIFKKAAVANARGETIV